MEKRNIQPQQQKPVARPTVVKPIAGLSEEQLTAGWTGSSGAISSSELTPVSRGGGHHAPFPIAGDDAE